MLSLIVAVAEDGAVGIKNKLLWHISEDLKYFKAATLGNPVIMGRKTFESIGRPLPGRRNIIVSHQNFPLPEVSKLKKDGTPSNTSVELANDFEQLARYAQNSNDEFFVIGGGSIYKEFFKFADRLYITKIYSHKEGADTFFPEIKMTEWTEIKKSPVMHDAENNIDFQFITYQKY
ncbi:MAG: dihydrofolate reductase [Bacteroidales bacterium]|nr:dihydrofolate reductase [Bacteroidales bacterium]MDD3910894.1 dihydrofolate reductase [Bacteroidales bacterium]MDD4420267.1 dihydrofolate reductase [Bacteroidales bacterium]